MLTYEQELVNFLVQPENLPIALEIGAHIEEVKDRLQYEFWLAIHKELESLLDRSVLCRDWRVRRANPSWEPTQDWYYCCIEQKTHSSTSVNHLCIQLQQSNRSSDHRLYYGIRWDHTPTSESEQAAANGLESGLKDAGFQPVPPWYVGLRYLDHYARRDDFLIAMAERPEDLTTQIAQIVWTFFEQWHVAVAQVDAELVT